MPGGKSANASSLNERAPSDSSHTRRCHDMPREAPALVAYALAAFLAPGNTQASPHSTPMAVPVGLRATAKGSEPSPSIGLSGTDDVADELVPPPGAERTLP